MPRQSRDLVAAVPGSEVSQSLLHAIAAYDLARLPPGPRDVAVDVDAVDLSGRALLEACAALRKAYAAADADEPDVFAAELARGAELLALAQPHLLGARGALNIAAAKLGRAPVARGRRFPNSHFLAMEIAIAQLFAAREAAAPGELLRAIHAGDDTDYRAGDVAAAWPSVRDVVERIEPFDVDPVRGHLEQELSLALTLLPSGAPRRPDLTDHDVALLIALRNSLAVCSITRLAEATGIGRNNFSVRLSYLAAKDLACEPFGKGRGFALTPAGHALFARWQLGAVHE